MRAEVSRPAPKSPPPEPHRKKLDPAVADILRQEAELESKARKTKAPDAMESQPDLGLRESDHDDEAARRAREARDRMARMRGEEIDEDDAAEAAATAAAVGSRRDLLPDIEEINSTLRSSSDRAAVGEPADQVIEDVREKAGFRRGFSIMLLLIIMLWLLYAYAPQLAEKLPQADPWISAYVGMVDQGRMWLDGQVAALLGWLDATATSSGN